MSATRTRLLSPTPEFLSPWSGKPPGTPVRAREIEEWIQEGRRRMTAAGQTPVEIDSVLANGPEMSLTFTDDLTEIEQARETLAGLTTLADMAQRFRNAKGESTVSTADFNAFLDQLLALAQQKAFAASGDTPGAQSTQDPAAPPAAPNTNEPPAPETEAQRRSRFDAVLKESGFKWPEQSIEIGNMAVQHGFTLDEVNRYTAPGA